MWFKTCNALKLLPTSLNTLSSFAAFMMNSGYPTMLYIASACKRWDFKKIVKDTFPHQVAVLYISATSAQKHQQNDFMHISLKQE